MIISFLRYTRVDETKKTTPSVYRSVTWGGPLLLGRENDQVVHFYSSEHTVDASTAMSSQRQKIYKTVKLARNAADMVVHNKSRVNIISPYVDPAYEDHPDRDPGDQLPVMLI